MRSIINSTIVWYLTLALSFAAIALGQFLFDMSDGNFPWFFVALACLTLLAILVARPADGSGRLILPWTGIPIVLLGCWLAMSMMFGMTDVHAVIFHVRHGVGDFEIPGYLISWGLQVAVLAGTICLILTLMLSRRPMLRRFDRLLAVPLILLNPFTDSLVRSSGWFYTSADTLVERYVDPRLSVGAQRTTNRPNLLVVYLESAEQTFEHPQFEGVMEPILNEARRGFRATGIEQVSQTQWTTAGMVASLCGVPLVQPFLLPRNGSGTEGGLMPAAHCLGDVLSGQGYTGRFVIQGDGAFAGLDRFYGAHGFGRIMDSDHISARYPDAKSGSYGAHDEWLLKAVHDQLRELHAARAEGGQPFVLATATMGGHNPAGFVSPACENGEVPLKASIPILRGVECANRLTARMLERARTEGLLENTIVVLVSDHLSMKSSETAKLNALKRRNFFAMTGPGISPHVANKPASMVDVYPTILAAMGFELRGDRAALGVDLATPTPTAVGELGRRGFDDAILSDRKLKRVLWHRPEERLASLRAVAKR